MVQSIDQALVTEFSGMVHHEAQQMLSKMRPYAKIKEMSGDVFAYDGLGRVEAREVTGRVNPATFDDIDHNRRKISRRRFVINLPVDSSDVRGALLDPDSEYAKAIVAGMQRQWDRVIQDAAFANVLTGRDFETSVTFANDGGLTVDATGGLTYEKLLEIAQNWIDTDVDYETGSMLQLTGDEHTSLMGEIELISGDFTRDFVVESGRIKKALGMDLISFAANVSNPIIVASGGERNLIAATKNAFCVGVSKEISLSIKERDDYIETTQVQAILEIGAVRTEGALVQKVTVTE
jgi:hypothetical protein